MRRLRVPRKTALALVVLVTALAVIRSGPPAGTVPGYAAHTAAASAAPAVLDSVSRPDTAAAASGGLCSVPGVGDIGGLLGFCSLGSSGLIGQLNNICNPSLPDPEPADSGIDAMVAPPVTGKQPATLYDEYGVAGDYWSATNLQCSDMTSLIGNNVAGMVFDAAKSLDRVTITVYQSAAGEGILSWLQRVADRLITSLGNAIYFPYLAIVVILGAIWLAWQGLIRKRGTRTIEGTIWMVVACSAAILLIGKPADVTGLGKGVSDGMSQALNAAFAKLPSPGPSSCVPLSKGDPQAQPATYNYTSGGTVVDQNADELWTVLVCKPWLDGEFGTSEYAAKGGVATPVNTYGRALLWSQAIAANEKPTAALMQAKQDTFAGIATSIQTNDPAIYPLFQGKEWTTRLEIAFAALFAAVVAGVLVLLISVTLILLKLGFLLLLVVGPFFLLVGTHPGFGRVLAMRWLELLVGVLLKQAAMAVVLSVLLYCYALIMGTSDAVLPWALKILMIALVTVAAFIYRKPFQHLFSAVGYGVIGSHDAAAGDLQRAGAAARANTRAAATLAPPFAAYRVGRWVRRNPGQAASLAAAAGTGGAAAVAAGVTGAETGQHADGGVTEDATVAAGNSADGAPGRATLGARARAFAAPDGSPAGEPPPLNLRARNGAGPAAAAGAAPGASPANGASAGSVPAGPATSGPAVAGVAGRAAWPAGRVQQSRPAPAAAPGPGGGSGSWPSAAGTSQRAAAASPAAAPSAPPSRPAAPPRQAAAPRQPARSRPAGPSRAAAPSRAGTPSRAAPPPAAPPPAAPAGPAPRPSAPRASGPRPPVPRAPWVRRQEPPPPRPPRAAGSGRAAASAAPLDGPDQPPPVPRAGPAPAPERPGPFWLRPLRRR